MSNFSYFNLNKSEILPPSTLSVTSFEGLTNSITTKTLTEQETLEPVLKSLCDWGKDYMNLVNK